MIKLKYVSDITSIFPLGTENMCSCSKRCECVDGIYMNWKTIKFNKGNLNLLR